MYSTAVCIYRMMCILVVCNTDSIVLLLLICTGEVVGATDKAAVKLINKVFFPDQEVSVQPAVPLVRELITLYCTLQVEDALVAADTNSSTSSTPIAVAVHPADMRSYTASPQERFGDALASLDYLLTSELPYEWTEVR